MRYVDLQASFELEINQIDANLTKPKSIDIEYWLNKGYKMYQIDIRDYTILEMIQIFFPDIDKIPDYALIDESVEMVKKKLSR